MQKNPASSLWSIRKEHRYKVLYLAMVFFFLSACQAIWRPLKTSIFAKTVGASFTPDAKLYVLFFLIPLIIFYSKLVDWLRRHQLVYCFALFHGVGGLIFYYLLQNPVYGIANTATSPDRYLGWAFYFFMESFSAFLATTFWSFADSVNDPDSARNYYGFFVAGSKIGGIISSAILYIGLSYLGSAGDLILPGTLFIGSILLVCAAGSIYLLVSTVPSESMHGYEAAYRVEQKEARQRISFMQSLRGALEGLWITFKTPYVFGIFLLVLFYEVIIVIFDYRVLIAADAANTTAGELTAYYALYYLCMHGVGLVISLLGTMPLQRLVGIQASLYIAPVVSLLILGYACIHPTASVFFICLVLLRALNYALHHPTREILYIPTTKAIKFKAKAWSDAFGSRFAKGCGSLFNIVTKQLSYATALSISNVVSGVLVLMWIIVVHSLGKTLQKAIKEDRVIGDDTKKA